MPVVVTIPNFAFDAVPFDAVTAGFSEFVRSQPTENIPIDATNATLRTITPPGGLLLVVERFIMGTRQVGFKQAGCTSVEKQSFEYSKQ
jgi:hypothetical protein